MKTASKDFKMTELGPIPKDWEVKRLGDVCSRIRNGFAYDFREGGAFAVSRIETISSGMINYAKVGMIKEKPSEDYRMESGDILFSHINSLPYIGNVAQYDGSRVLYHGMNLLLLRPDAVDARYLYYILSSEPMRWQARAAAKVAINQASINISEVSNFAIRNPPLPEQRKIAAALSDVDEMIAALEKLVEKKRKIKTGAMQRLLTGRTRLPGFKGEWVERRLGDVSDIITGATPSTNVAAYWGGTIRWMSSGEVHLKYVKDVAGRITRQGFDSASTCMLPEKTVLIALAGQGKTRGTVAISLIPLCTNQSIAGIVPSSSVSPDFLYHCLDARYEDLRMISSGDGSRGGLSKQILLDYGVDIPPTLAEQKAIAKVLGDMDEEIAALEAELAKTRHLKQGMMQELLTGKVRLV